MQQSCQKCRRNPGLRKVWGCDSPSQEVVEDGIPGEGDEVVQFYSCPNRFVPRSVAQWHRLFRFREIDFPHTMPAFEALGRRYIAFREYFLSMKNEMQAAIAVSGEAS